jgi:flagellar L-ring protein precursor FlgH
MSRKHLVLGSVALLVATAVRAESLYDANTFQPLTADNKAHRVGDALTIHVFERSSAETRSDTSTQRTNRLDAGLGTSAINAGRGVSGSVDVGGSFEGGGTTQRANRLLAVLTVTVREVLPNGDLRVGGEQLLTVNQEQHKVNVEGRVRPQDISADNVVLSTRIADAKLTYAGEGDLTDRHKRAWWRALLDFLGF